MEWSLGTCELLMRTEPYYKPGSADNLRSYDRVIDLSEGYGPSVVYGLEVRDPGGKHTSVVVLGGGGATSLQEKSIVFADGVAFLGIGNAVVALRLPTLEVAWLRQVDFATCFGVHLLPDTKSLVVHGELAISRLSLDGELVWEAHGRDVFTGPLSLLAGSVVVVDFNGDSYSINLESGAIGA